jgi:hypothetical protein
MTPLERIHMQIRQDQLTDCWIWQGNKSPKGYGVMYFDGRPMVRAHQVAYQLIVGPIPNGLQLDHLCRNPSCVNPKHLEPVTCKENVLRGIGVTAINARKTHCPKGHSLSGENLYLYKGWRSCKICRNESSKKSNQRRKLI